MGKIKSDLKDLKGSAGETGEALDYSFSQSRGGLMLVEQSVGVHVPRALNTLLAQIPAVGAAFAVMLPIAGVAVAVEIIGKLIQKHREILEQAERIEQTQNSLGATIATVYTNLEDKLLQAGIKADELSGNHLAAVHKELELIDHQSLKELGQEFDVLAKAADQAFLQLKTSWYQFGDGSARAKHNLAEFQSQYELLLAEGKKDEANALLQGRVAYEEHILSLQKEVSEDERLMRAHQMEWTARYAAAARELDEAKAGSTEQEIKSQQDLVDILHAQVSAHEQISKTTDTEKGNVITKENLKTLSDEANLQKIVTSGVDAHAAALRKLAQTQAETALEATKGQHEETPDDRLNESLKAIQIEHDASITEADQILASKKTTYESEVKAAGQNVEKKKELDAQYVNAVRAHDDALAQADAEAAKKSVTVTAATEAEKLRIRVTAEQAAADKVLEQSIADDQRNEKHALQSATDLEALHHQTASQTLSQQVAAVNAEKNAEVFAYMARLAALDKFSSDYQKKVEEYNAKITAVEKKAADEITDLKAAAEQKQLLDIQHSGDRMKESIASDIAKSIVMNKSLAQSFRQTGEAMLEGMTKNLIMMKLTGDKQKLIDAKMAFHNAMGEVPFPMNLVVAPAMFAATMAFEHGGEIPGEGAVPIIGHGGETVVTRALTERVEAAEGHDSRPEMHMHNVFAPQIHAIDADGVDAMLKKHAITFQRHVESVARKRHWS
jgi:hypothetical protein